MKLGSREADEAYDRWHDRMADEYFGANEDEACEICGGDQDAMNELTADAERFRALRELSAQYAARYAEGVASALTQMLGMEIDMSEERSAGMYEVSDPTYQQVKVGKYTICRQDEKSVWIQTDDGEGGQFSDEAFFAAVDAFYRANF